MASVPLSGTNIRLLSGVPFSGDYKDTRWFDTKSEQTTYFTSKPTVHTMAEANFQRIDGYYYVSVNANIDSLYGANYLMFQNAQYNSKWFYAFITKLEYVQKNSTKVHFKLDVFQTWKFDMNFKSSFIVREHCKLWNADGTPVLNTVDEGLDYGKTYDTVYAERFVPNDGYQWLVMVSKTPLHGTETAIDPSLIGVPTPLSYYVVPFKNGNVPTIRLGTETYPITPPTRILKEIYKNEKATNNIVSLFITEDIGLGTSVSGSVMTISTETDTINQVSIGGTSAFMLHVSEVLTFKSKVVILQNDKYEGYTKPKESKLLMYPYTVLTLDDFKGSRMDYHNELIPEKSLRLMVKGSLGTTNKVSYGIEKYNVIGASLFAFTNNEYALFNTSSNDVPIVTDMLSAYLQGNKNSIENQRNSAYFNGAMNASSSVLGAISPIAGGASLNPLSMGQGASTMAQGAGNTVLQLQGIQAKQNDIANLPPQISKMGSNTPYDFGNGYQGVFILKKQIKPEYQVMLSDFFNMYGYKVNRVKNPNFHTRKYWNYVQTKNCIILGNFNNDDLLELKSVFDNGITLWHTDDVGNYALENEVI